MAARLGDVLYWFACGAATVWSGIFGSIYWAENRHEPGLLVAAAIGAFLIWIAGRAFRYVLAGR